MALTRGLLCIALTAATLDCCLSLGSSHHLRSHAVTKGMVLQSNSAFASPSKRQYVKRSMCAAAIPGESAGEDVIVGGLQNFFQIYNNLLVGRVLLSWFPAAQSMALLQPVFNVCDPYLNLFRGILPPLGGIDFSPILAFTFIQVAGGSMSALGAEPSSSTSRRLQQRKKLAPWSLERAVNNYYAGRSATGR